MNRIDKIFKGFSLRPLCLCGYFPKSFVGQAWWWVPLLAYALIAVVATHPLWLNPASAVPSDIGDPLLNTWILAWDVHALTVSPLNLFQANIYFPLPNTLAFSEHLLGTALTVLPALLLTGEPVVAYNAAFWLSFVLGGWGTYLLAHRYTRRPWAAFLAGLAFAYAPYRLTAFSHLQLLTFQWLPFALLCLEQTLTPTLSLAGRGGTTLTPTLSLAGRGGMTLAHNPLSPKGERARVRGDTHGEKPTLTPPLSLRGRGRFVVGFALFLWLQATTSWHLAVFTGYITAIYVAGWWLRLERGQRVAGLIRVAVALLAAAALTWPLVPPYLAVMDELQAARPVEVASGFGAHPADYLAAPPWNRTFGLLTAPLSERPLFTEENFMFAGVAALTLALVGLWDTWRRRRQRQRDWAIARVWLVIGLGAWILSWGPYLRIGDWTLPLPYLFLSRLSPVFGLIRVPPRWMAATALPAAVLVGYGARAIWEMCCGEYRVRSERFSASSPATKKRAMNRSLRTSAFGGYGKPPYVAWVLSGILGALLVLESWSVPLPLARVGTTGELAPVYRWLAAQPGDFGVIEWPLYVAPRPEYPETKRLYASVIHWKGLVNGYSGFTPERQAALDAELASFPDERSLEALRDLGRHGVRYLVVHTLEQGFDRACWEETDRWALERSATTLPVYEWEGDVVYEINPWGDVWVADPESVPDETWRARAPHPSGASWQNGLVCIAYLSGEAAGDMRYVDFFWRRTAPIPRGLSVFVHLLDAQGNIVAQGDGPMVEGRFPTPEWSRGEVVQDRRLLVPVEGADVATGIQLRIGLYYAETGERIPVLGEDGRPRGDHLLLPWELNFTR